MPFTPDIGKAIRKLGNFFGVAIYPVLVSLAMPVFLFNIVSEKEARLLQNMKISGLQMVNYWTVNYLFNTMFYLMQVTVFYIFGRYVVCLTFFVETDGVLLWLALLGWGLCQTSLAFVYSSFVDKAQSASVLGYSIAIVLSILVSCVMLSGGCQDENNEMIHYFRIHPTLCFVRIIYVLSDACTWNSCYGIMEYAPPEIFGCLKMLYFHSVAYMVLALYLHEVVPGTYGVPKHPLFFIERCVRNTFLHPWLFSSDEMYLAKE